MLRALALLAASQLCTPTDADTRCVRHVTLASKRVVLRRSGIPWRDRDQYEVDHYIPLCLGGSNHELNLWAEPWPHAHAKDVLEWRLCRLVREGRMPQPEAVSRIRADKP